MGILAAGQLVEDIDQRRIHEMTRVLISNESPDIGVVEASGVVCCGMTTSGSEPISTTPHGPVYHRRTTAPSYSNLGA
jgi:hypothetical protein